MSAPPPGGFCDRHFSWLCQAGQGKCQAPAPDDPPRLWWIHEPKPLRPIQENQ